ncbi:MAG: carboxypeptidase M32 [Tissierellia bacterium]|nr:carboxypeptidase M32 [Tissierellia bacterium]
MSTYEQNIKQLKETIKIQRYYGSINSLMAWDLWQGLPVDGREYRQSVTGYFIKEASNLIKSNETKKLVEYFRELDDNRYENIYDKAAARVLINKYDKAVKVPIELQIEMNNFTSTAQMAWKEALDKSDFNMYKPYIKKSFELKAKVAEAIDNTKNPLDVLVDDVDEGLTVAKIDELFSELKVAIIDILEKIRDKNETIDDSFLNVNIDKENVKSICSHIVENSFFDKNKGTYQEVLHPVLYGVGPRDVRVTTNYKRLIPCIFSMLHECGHGIYEYSGNDKVVEYSLYGGISGTMHESQSRFYENLIGKSYEFWQYFYTFLQSEVNEFKNIDLDKFYNALNKVKPSLRRLDADELTYNLHPIIRFEMEKEYFQGNLKTDDFYEAWNAKYKEYLGLEPKNAKEGVLQDVHWASGHIGYFQSYTLGNVYGGQFRNKLLEAYPNVYKEISFGNFDSLNKWMYENIHQYGNLYTQNDLIKKATGEEIKSKYFIDYLYEKFL